MSDSTLNTIVQGQSIHCPCGQKYHVSLFGPILRRIGAACYNLGASSPDEIVDQVIDATYRGNPVEATHD